jgi:tetrahydromethanopterin S-methyltransferase subunit G
MNDLAERLDLDQEEMKPRLVNIENRLNEIETRLDDMARGIEIRHADLWKLIETRLDDMARGIEIRHADTWKLLVEIPQVLPIAVSMSTSEVLAKLTDSIKADIADSRQEIVGKISSSNVDPT